MHQVRRILYLVFPHRMTTAIIKCVITTLCYRTPFSNLFNERGTFWMWGLDLPFERQNCDSTPIDLALSSIPGHNILHNIGIIIFVITPFFNRRLPHN